MDQNRMTISGFDREIYIFYIFNSNRQQPRWKLQGNLEPVDSSSAQIKYVMNATKWYSSVMWQLHFEWLFAFGYNSSETKALKGGNF